MPVEDPTDPRYSGDLSVNRVAETHFYLRLQLHRALESQELTTAGRARLGGATTYAQYWRASWGDRFFDMGTFLRLGSAVEMGLRDYHAGVAGSARAREVSKHQRGVFQRLVQPADLVRLLRDDCSVDLESNKHFQQVREVMVHRHLFAHASGLADDRYLRDIQAVLGHDLRPELEQLGYPDLDVYWFEPLKRLSPGSEDAGLIEGARAFFRELPAAPG